ncbi:hypothetical protein B566_EDAN011797 [Ephemera danica]|nr:hypothetical protein B566_EDAN011797 [Ephemera danica]
MGLEKFQIVFDNPYGVYYGGQNISGRILVAINSAKKVRGNDQTLQTGEHAFPFNYVLPANIPSSFEGEHGHVRYTVRAVIDRPWKFDHETKMAFSVICPLDLNMDPKLSQPIHCNTEKTFCCFCCASGPLNVTLSLPAGGAVPGETLLPTIEVENTSNVYISQIKLLFVKSVTYRAKAGSTKLDEVNISEKQLGYVDPGKSQTWTKEALAIPALPPSNLSNCNIINLNYYVRLILKPSGWHQGVTLSLPVLLGTIPFHQHFSNFSSAPSQPPLGWNLAPSSPQHDGSPSYPDLR